MILQDEISAASAYINELENKFYKANLTSLEYLKKLQQSELDNEDLIAEI